MRSWKILEAQNFPTPTGPWWKISSSCGKWCGELGIGSLGPCIEPHLHLRRWKHWKLDIKIIKSINRSWLLNDDVSVFNLPRKSVFLWFGWCLKINSVGLAPAPAEPGENLEKLRISGENTESLHVRFYDMFMKCSYEMFMSVVSLSPLLPCFNRFACSKGRTCWHAANRISFNDASMEHGVSCKIGCQCSQVECTGTQLKWEDLEKSWVCLQTGYPATNFMVYHLISVIFRITITIKYHNIKPYMS